MRILIVDDEYVSRTKLKALLSGYGDCDAVQDGEMALQMIRKAYQEAVPYDLITMDIMMPDMSGHEVVRELRDYERDHPELSRGFESRVLMITATKRAKDVMTSFSEGAAWYLVKPVTPENLKEAISQIEFPSFSSQPESASGDAAAADPAGATQTLAETLTLPDPRRVSLHGVDEEFLTDYLDSTRGKLPELEARALELEQQPGSDELANSIMRTLHSLKGEAGMIGLNDVQNVCHETETIVRNRGGDASCVDIVLKVKDWIETVVQFIVDPSSMPRPASNVSPSETTPAAPTLSLPDPNSVDTSNVAEEFWADYLATTSAKLDELQDVLEELRGGIDYDANRQNVIRILNFLKGEGGMIGLGKIQKVLQQAENIFRDSVIVEDAVETVFRALEWVAHVLEIAQNRSPSKT